MLIDLPGPKIRCGRFVDGKIELNPDDRFVLDTDWMSRKAARMCASVSLIPALEVSAGDTCC